MHKFAGGVAVGLAIGVLIPRWFIALVILAMIVFVAFAMIRGNGKESSL